MMSQGHFKQHNVRPYLRWGGSHNAQLKGGPVEQLAAALEPKRMGVGV